MLHEFSNWLATTPLSIAVQSALWLIPLAQTIHILALSIVFSSVVILDLRLAGWAGRAQSIAETAQRFLPWIWGGVAVLLASGLVLIVGEPPRALLNPAFQAKLALLAVVLVLTRIVQRGLARDPAAWDAPGGGAVLAAPGVGGVAAGGVRTTPAARLLGLLSLGLWIAIVVLGRWIAYVIEN